jgi:hypothetical protein
MYKRVSIILALALAVMGCDSGQSSTQNGNGNGNLNVSAFKIPDLPRPNTQPDPAFKPCNAYFPLVPGSTARYVINYPSGLVADMTVAQSKTDDPNIVLENITILDRLGGLEIAQTIERKYRCDGESVLIISEETKSKIQANVSNSMFNYRDNSVVMKPPAELATKGATWTYGYYRITEIPGVTVEKPDTPIIITLAVGGEEELKTGLGTFRALRVVRKVSQNTVNDFYVRGLGLVKRVSGEGAITELKEYSGLQPME